MSCRPYSSWSIAHYLHTTIAAYLAWTEDIIHVFQKSFIFDLVVREDERNAFTVAAGSPVQPLEIIH